MATKEASEQAEEEGMGRLRSMQSPLLRLARISFLIGHTNQGFGFRPEKMKFQRNSAISLRPGRLVFRPKNFGLI